MSVSLSTTHRNVEPCRCATETTRALESAPAFLTADHPWLVATQAVRPPVHLLPRYCSSTSSLFTAILAVNSQARTQQHMRVMQRVRELSPERGPADAGAPIVEEAEAPLIPPSTDPSSSNDPAESTNISGREELRNTLDTRILDGVTTQQLMSRGPSKSENTGAIIGAVLGALLLAALVAGGTCCVMRARRRKSEPGLQKAPSSAPKSSILVRHTLVLLVDRDPSRELGTGRVSVFWSGLGFLFH